MLKDFSCTNSPRVKIEYIWPKKFFLYPKASKYDQPISRLVLNFMKGIKRCITKHNKPLPMDLHKKNSFVYRKIRMSMLLWKHILQRAIFYFRLKTAVAFVVARLCPEQKEKENVAWKNRSNWISQFFWQAMSLK